ncbi:uncharacterized protein LOC126816353 isoform X2 [Patella vulgata]|uniref:uncharacterized protein LOC126816353 isoform X2 n=1 Tax=Patella vulgata TaxID=6465 RepID=UPI00217F49C4|nr:uncharacterized protein LOC126816353 isoform X2 [Patella vulgata]
MSFIVQRPCSEDASYETIDIIPVEPTPPKLDTTQSTPVSNRTSQLTHEQFKSFLDEDGRLVNENGLRKAIFLGGVDPSIRKEVWQFLFGLYPYTSTKREREELLIDYMIKYHELKNRWKTILVLDSRPGATLLDQGLFARYQIVEKSQVNPDKDTEDNMKHNPSAADIEETSSKFAPRPLDLSLLDQIDVVEKIHTPDMEQKVEFMKLQAQVFVQRQKIDVQELRSHIRVIDKDVPRTDRDEIYFKGSGNPRLTELREVLITFCAYNTELGYAQGMNDILSRFLYIMGSEVESFWCFKSYMEKIKDDFMEEGMVKKIDLVKMLLGEIDPYLLKHFEVHELGNLFFCHRWLLLGFKREFSFQDSLRCFEILSSHHLELSSIEAETAVRREEMKEFASSGGDTRTIPLQPKEYTFEVFMCVALLIECREELFKCNDIGMVFTCINNLKMDLDNILCLSERLFFTYCKKTVEDSFHMVDEHGGHNHENLTFSQKLIEKLKKI